MAWSTRVSLVFIGMRRDLEGMESRTSLVKTERFRLILLRSISQSILTKYDSKNEGDWTGLCCRGEQASLINNRPDGYMIKSCRRRKTPGTTTSSRRKQRTATENLFLSSLFFSLLDGCFHFESLVVIFQEARRLAARIALIGSDHYSDE